MFESEDSIESYWEVIRLQPPLIFGKYRPLLSIESYWEDVRPHLVERAHQRRLLAEHHKELKEFLDQSYLENKCDHKEFLRSDTYLKNEWLISDGYKFKEWLIPDGYNFKE